MLSQPPLWLIAVAFVLAIGPLVFFHELGHYLMARAFGIGAETFSIGFGREIAGWTDKLGTRWKVGWLPLGGYVKFIGDENAASQPATVQPVADRRAFHGRPVWQRFLVVLAGPVANFVLAIVIFAVFLAAFGLPNTPPVVQSVVPNTAAAASGIQSGDRILRLDSNQVNSFEDVTNYVLLRPGKLVSIDLLRHGELSTLTVRLGSTILLDQYGQGSRVGLLGIGRPKRESKRLSAAEVIPASVVYTYHLTRSMIDGLGQVVHGRLSAKELGGPLKMAQIAGQQAALGPFEFIQLLAFLSINLGFINLLPVPMLDGGHLAFYAVEAVRRRPLKGETLDWAFRGGLALLLALLVLLTVNDLSSFGLFDRLGRLIG